MELPGSSVGLSAGFLFKTALTGAREIAVL